MQHKLHPKLRADSANRYVRSAVGVSSPHEVCFALSDQPVTFYELATMFRDELHCSDALYLDGFISRFYIAGQSTEEDSTGEFAGLLAVVAPSQNK